MHQSRAITRRSASNLALAFVLLPRAKRDAMSALYAFCREVDDVADETSAPLAERRARLAAWREDLRRAATGGQPQLPVNRELQPVIARYRLPLELFDELLQGVEMDLEITRYADYPQLELYCYRVASVVGLLSIEIFGYRNPACRDYAVHLGRALQFTNILRDVRTDAARGRIYLPQTELTRFGVAPEEILHGEFSERYAALAASVAERARGFYRQARATLPSEDRRAMVAAELMGAVYWRLLNKLAARRFNVFDRAPVRLSRAGKLALILRAWLAHALDIAPPAYGHDATAGR
ncbi:MAG: presqualene diphosphate synthase HpnD [Verrucomicrobiales bacterium]|nr:presqualene diphosphate synthase HpnD [Verrucomicrobiales bacterium]